ncbi:hypothetical protein [Tepidibacter thalassicus]|uniref:hypothetical protein n=1 Tax=Tepidibacter thalassicus TaxID=214905 RepID=UPI001A9A4870|nr:hypothetical protein [Tepidibacter thalassicus]
MLISKFVKEKEVKLSKEDINEYVNTCMNYINNIKNYIKEKLIMLNKVTTNGNGLCDYEENVKRYYSLIDNSVKSEFGYDYIVYTQNTCEYNQVNWNYNIFSIKYNLSKYKKSYKKVDSIFITFHKHNTLTMKEVLRLVEEFLPKDCAQIDSIIENNSSKIKYTILYKSNLIKKNKSIIKVVLLKIKEPLVHSKEDIVEYKEQFVSAKIF